MIPGSQKPLKQSPEQHCALVVHAPLAAAPPPHDAITPTANKQIENCGGPDVVRTRYGVRGARAG
jgi:hypothetical protein